MAEKILQGAGLRKTAQHVAFEEVSPSVQPKSNYPQSPPLKGHRLTLLVYYMNGEPLPLPHGFPIRVLTLGWVGASCCKWLKKIMVLGQPYEGHYMDKMYCIYQKGEDPKSGTVVTAIPMKAIITQPSSGEAMKTGRIVVLGAAYGGEARLSRLKIPWMKAKLGLPQNLSDPTNLLHGGSGSTFGKQSGMGPIASWPGQPIR